MADPKAYEPILERIDTVFKDKSFLFSQIAIETSARNEEVREALAALVSDGLLTVVSERPTVYRLKKYVEG